MLGFEERSIVLFFNIHLHPTVTGCVFHVAKNPDPKSLVSDGSCAGRQMLNLTENQTRYGVSVPLVGNITRGFVELTPDPDPQDLLQEWFLTLKSCTGGARPRDWKAQKPRCPQNFGTFVMDRGTIGKEMTVWKGFHETTQSSVTNLHPHVWKKISS